MQVPRTFELASPNIVSETVEGESIVLNLESGFYYSLNESASQIWDALCAGFSEGALAAALAARHDLDQKTAAETVATFAARLVGENLLKASPAGPADALRSPDLAGQDGPFAPPELTRYEDIQELLIIDPIHEVDADGWPSRPEPDPTDGTQTE